jgi:predicted RNA-binding protein associated with RNAse of E/G family
MWSEGDVICVRQTWLGRVWQAHAWYVVADRDDELVLFAPIGAEAWFSGIPIPCDEWMLKRSSFKEHLLLFARPGEGYSTSLIWDASWTLREWYVNFERPLRPRSSIGFEYVDLALDLVVYPDGTHKLLDEDELKEALERGVLTREDAAAAYADAAMLTQEWPFPTGWEDWRPDPGWEPPTLPAGWDTIEN